MSTGFMPGFAASGFCETVRGFGWDLQLQGLRFRLHRKFRRFGFKVQGLGLAHAQLLGGFGSFSGLLLRNHVVFYISILWQLKLSYLTATATFWAPISTSRWPNTLRARCLPSCLSLLRIDGALGLRLRLQDSERMVSDSPISHSSGYYRV